MLSNYEAWKYLWHPVCSAAELAATENGVREVKLLGKVLVVARLSDGLATFQGFCRHRSAALALGSVEGNCLRCSYHGWLYDDTGRCVEIPALSGKDIPRGARIERYESEEKYGLIWVRLRSGMESSIPEVPYWDSEVFHYYQYEPIDWCASATRTVEGFFDLAHFPFIHPTSLGNPDHTEVTVPTDFRQEKGEMCFRYSPKPGARRDGLGAENLHSNYRLAVPFNIHLESVNDGENYCVWQALCPVDSENVRIFFAMARPRPYTEYDGWIQNVQRIIDEDKAIIESQSPKEVEGLRHELSTEADKASMVYRRFISRLSKEFGENGPAGLSKLLGRTGALQ